MHAEDEVVPILKQRFRGHVSRGVRDGAPLSDELIEIIQTYANLHQELMDVRNELHDVNRQIDSAEALSIWDSVTDEK